MTPNTHSDADSPRSRAGTPHSPTLDRFLEIEFLHSLGCYTNARCRSKELMDGCSDSAWKDVLVRTFCLNELLEKKRDLTEAPSRHPNPCKGRAARTRTQPFLLEENTDFTPIAEFYGLTVEALSEILSPCFDCSSDPDLERFGKCLFWDHDPTNASSTANEQFEGERETIDDIRVGRRDREGFERDPAQQQRIEIKRARYDERLGTAIDALRPKLTRRGRWEGKDAEDEARKLLGASLASRKGDPDPAGEPLLTPLCVIKCLVAAHLRLHHVEHLLSKPFKEAAAMAEVARERVMRLLLEAEALNTFVFLFSRRFPWFFSETEEEAATVLDSCVRGFGKGDPEGYNGATEADPEVFPSLLRSRLIGFLALHRRAFGHALRDSLGPTAHNHAAFNDFRKLQHLVRIQKRVLNEGTDLTEESIGELKPQVYLDGMDALAETHIGDLYRADHAHPVALEHFCDAQDRLDQLSTGLRESAGGIGTTPAREGPAGVADELQDSRWRIHLMLSKGKGFYEVGNLKRSVKWMLRSWSALLTAAYFMEAEKKRARGKEPDPWDEETFTQLQNAIELLSKIRNDPDFRKADLQEKLEPIVETATRIATPKKFSKELQAIAAEILLRLGHVLFVLQLGENREREEMRDDTRWVEPEPEERDGLALACLRLAARLDPHSTLAAADLLKIQYKQAAGTEVEDDSEAPGESESGENRQWPFGRGSSEQMIRMVEYLLLRWLVKSEQGAVDPAAESASDNSPPAVPIASREADRLVARRLIADLLIHTDSINVRQSQVYRYLMQPRQGKPGGGSSVQLEGEAGRGPTGRGQGLAIEFVCLRRYSSFFPFVPRPSAFRSVGGGYLLRLHHQDKACEQPFGIAVDPGPDFIENLYRCGFGLGDIDMIIITHDHSDHSADLYPILSLLGYRMRHGDRTFNAPSRATEVEEDDWRSRACDRDVRRMLIVGNESVARQLRFFNKPHITERGAGDSERLRSDALQILSFDEFDAFREEMSRIRDKGDHPEVAIPDELRLKPVVSVGHRDAFGMLAYGFRISLGDEGPSIGFTGDTGGFRLSGEEVEDRRDEEDGGDGEAGEDGEPGGNRTRIEWEVESHDGEGVMELTGHSTWREHWRDVLSSDVLIAHVSGLPLPQLQALASRDEGNPIVKGRAMEDLVAVWDGLEDSVKSEVSFAFWLRKDRNRRVLRPLERIEPDYKWPESHLYLVGLLEFARAYRSERREVGKPGLFLVGELREELGSLRSKIATRIEGRVFEPERPAHTLGPEPGCRALTADVGLRLIVSREGSDPRVEVLCSTCDLDNDRTRQERFHDSHQIREVCVKGENEGMFYNCFNHDPEHHQDPVFLERVERYDVFSTNSLHY